MRHILPFAALLIVTFTFATTPAGAEEWCGFQEKAGAIVRCGYSSLQECKEKVEKTTKDSKSIVCMPSPSFASERREEPLRRG